VLGDGATPAVDGFHICQEQRPVSQVGGGWLLSIGEKASESSAPKRPLTHILNWSPSERISAISIPGRHSRSYTMPSDLTAKAEVPLGVDGPPPRIVPGRCW
jgi:hypothetical protein